MIMKITRFEINKEYSTRSICDHDCIFKTTIISRTAKTVTIKDNFNKEPVRKKIHIFDNAEAIYHLGIYSMAPVIRADREVLDGAVRIM
jgi:hypothetical protein